MRLVLQARYVFPVAAPPLADGRVAIQNGRIAEVGRDLRGDDVRDLGNVALLPGWVNAHTHLNLSGFDRPLGRPGVGLVEWIRDVVALQRARERTEVRDAVERGLRECAASGTAAVGDIVQPNEIAIDAELAGGVAFLELIAPTHERIADALDAAFTVRSAPPRPGWRPGLSPHAPYSLVGEVLDAAVRVAGEGRLPLAMHLAESREEMQWLRDGTGPLAAFLDDVGAGRLTVDRAGRRPLDFLRRLAEAPRALVVHGNYLDEEEIGFLAARAGRMSVVFCPRTHAYFGHATYPLAAMRRAGVRVALGTDSRASSPDLSLLGEMRQMAARFPDVPPAEVLAMGTLRGAEALGLEAEWGTLEPGKRAVLVAVALPQCDAPDPHELLFDSTLPVVETYRDTGESPLQSGWP